MLHLRLSDIIVVILYIIINIYCILIIFYIKGNRILVSLSIMRYRNKIMLYVKKSKITVTLRVYIVIVSSFEANTLNLTLEVH